MSPRRPYLDLKSSIVNLFRYPSRYIRETMDKESEFEKPYLTGEYRKMHLNIPTPDWPEIRRPDINTPWLKPHHFGGVGSPFEPVGPFPPKEPGFILCTAKFLQAGGDCDAMTVITAPLVPEYNAANYWRISEVFSGEVSIISEGYEGTPYAILQISPDGNDEAIFEICFVQPAGEGECTSCDTFSIDCCCDDADDYSFEWDWTDSAQTIIQSDTATVEVIGGCPPYEWSISGSGFTLSDSSTTGVANTVNTDAAACGSADISVTDSCGERAYGSIRCTASGSWSLVSTDACSDGCDCDNPGVAETVTEYSTNNWYGDRFRGKNRYRQQTMWWCDSVIYGCAASFWDNHCVVTGGYLNNYITSDANYDIPCWDKPAGGALIYQNHYMYVHEWVC